MENLTKLKKLIKELNEWDALEFCPVTERGRTDCYLPYMMNDALEYYIILENCRIVGDFCQELQEETSAEVIQEEDRTGMIVRQGTSNVYTIWFRSFRIVRQCYQYHRIGHFWVQGQEQWRQLVYIIGTIYDKYTYIGSEVCNKKEQELLPLMHFPPFLMWFPLNEIPWEKYPFTKEGCKCMRNLALEAGDKGFAALIRLYEKTPSPMLDSMLGNALTKPRRIPLYNLILEKVRSASEEYPVRDYGRDMNRRINRERNRVIHNMERNGFTGKYPFFVKGDTQIFVTEEHPFTVMESESFHFRIQCMVSRCPNSRGGINSGFFTSRHNKGWITKDL